MATPTAREIYIGLISGTSADAIDAALVDFGSPQPQLLGQLAHPIPRQLQTELFDLMVPGDNEIDRLGVADQAMGELLADAVSALLRQTGHAARTVRGIGSHGQTIRHRPPGELARPFTLQIGDANQIATRTGITTVSDFRRRDMAHGGEGAPLVPAFHRAVFHSEACDRVVVNIGGIGNITRIPTRGQVVGFDTGPGNALMDTWIGLHHGEHYDRDGDWAASGKVQPALLSQLLGHPYFARPAPKSTGRETFTRAWLQSIAGDFPCDPRDVQATLLELTARTISDEVAKLGLNRDGEVYVCGGGAHNRRLMERLGQLLDPFPVRSTATLGLEPDWVEAMAFAWLARQTLNGLPGNLPSVTGADREVILGGIYPA